MHIVRIANIDELTALAGDWDRLARGVPFRGFPWLATWWRHYQPAMAEAGRHVELYVVCATQERKLVALAPWYLERSRAAGRVIHFMGTGEVCSDYLSVLCAAGQEIEVAESLADWLVRAGRNAAGCDRWDRLEMTDIDAVETAPRMLAHCLGQRGAGVYVRPGDNTWRLELPATWEALLGTLSKSHRKQLRRLQRRMFDTGRAVLRTVERADQLDDAWRILVRLHQRRLESLGKPGCFTSATYVGFHRSAAQALLAAGRLRLHWLEIAKRVVAAEYHLAGDDTVYAYQGGIEPDALHHQPGKLATLAAVERAIGGGYKAFDFCRGDEPYKAHWRATPRQSLQWRIFCDRSLARLRQHAWSAGENARHWLKRGLHAAWREAK